MRRFIDRKEGAPNGLGDMAHGRISGANMLGKVFFFMFPHGLLSHPINRGFPLGTATPDKGAFANNAGSW